MVEDLPDEFDIIVIGTGFIESCIAAAASRIGKTVLHIDQNDFYGGSWASFNLDNLNAFLENNKNPEIANTSYKWHIIDADSFSQIKTNILEKSRCFSLDLCPKILFSAGKLVQLLISSNICRYAEFRAVDRVLTTFNNELLNVPCSRSDVFNTKHLNIVEKRMLMKFLNNCLTFGEDKRTEDFLKFHGKTFLEYLQNQKLNEKITSCIVQAIAMCKNDTSFEIGIEKTLDFLKSIGKYGNTPFLFPMYGCGEIPQCFCRLCAVFGGIYCLKRRIENIVVDDDLKSALIKTEGKVIRAKHIVLSHGNIPTDNDTQISTIVGLESITNRLSRCIILSTTPFGNDEINSGCGGVNLLRLIDQDREAVFIQLSHYSGTCPKGYYIIHITTPANSSNPENDLKPFVEQILNDSELGSNIIYSAFFTITTRLVNQMGENYCSPIYVADAASFELDYDLSIRNAQKIFERIYPNNEFLPRAPDPEEIVVDGEDPAALSENNLPDDLREQLHTLGLNSQQMEIDVTEDNSNENI